MPHSIFLKLHRALSGTRLAQILVLTLAFARVSSFAADTSDRIVVVISVDGLAGFYFDDPAAKMPTIRALAAKGVRAERMDMVMPTVTWPNHTTLVTGVMPVRHGVVGNTYLDRQTRKEVVLSGDPVYNQDEIVLVPTLWDVAKKAGMKTAAVAWPASRGAKSLDWTVPFVLTNELFQRYGTPSLWAEFKQAGIAYENEEEGYQPGKGRPRDELNVQMFNHIIRTHRPQLAFLHILDVDHTQHVYGPRTREAYSAIEFGDSLVAKVCAELERDFPGHVTVILFSDHGMFGFDKEVHPNVVLRQAGLLKLDAANEITDAQVRTNMQGGCSLVYIFEAEGRQARLEQIVTMFSKLEGVDEVLTPKDYARYGLANPKDDPKAPDAILMAKPGYSFFDDANGDQVVVPGRAEIKGMHGYSPKYHEMAATFIASGFGIKPGPALGPISGLDVAPTIAKLLGLAMPTADGKVLPGVLSDQGGTKPAP